MFAVKFDDLRRKMLKKDVVLNKLVTAQIGTPEYEAYANLFTMPENDTIHMAVEDDNKTYTFYTILTNIKKEVANVADTQENSSVAKYYEVIKQIVDNPAANNANGDFISAHLVKLSKPHVMRLPDKAKYVEVDYVHVTAFRKTETDETGTFVYEETTVTPSDAENARHKGFLYFAPRALAIEEAMFAIGEIGTVGE